MEKLCGFFHIVLAKFMPIAVTIPPLVLTIGGYVVNYHSDDKTFYLIVPAMYVWNVALQRPFWIAPNAHIFNRFPFDWKTLVGYPIALLAQYAGSFTGMMAFVPIICFFIGSCWLVSSFVRDLTTELAQYFSDGQHPRKASGTKGAEMMNHFIRIIQFHVDAKQLSDASDSLFR